MLNDAHFNRVALVIAHFDFKRFVEPSRIKICTVIRAAALPGHVEGVAGIEADGLVLWGVVDVVLAGELELTVIVAPIETHASFWKRHAKMILGTVFELLHDPNFGVGEDAIAVLLAKRLERPIVILLVDFDTILNIFGLRLNACSADHFPLLGFTIVKSGRVSEGIKMIFFKSLFLL